MEPRGSILLVYFAADESGSMGRNIGYLNDGVPNGTEDWRGARARLLAQSAASSITDDSHAPVGARGIPLRSLPCACHTVPVRKSRGTVKMRRERLRRRFVVLRSNGG